MQLCHLEFQRSIYFANIVIYSSLEVSLCEIFCLLFTNDTGTGPQAFLTWVGDNTFSINRGGGELHLGSLGCTFEISSIIQISKCLSVWIQWRRLGGTCPPMIKRRQKLSKKNGIKLVGYIFRLKNYVKIPPPHFSQIFLSWRCGL